VPTNLLDLIFLSPKIESINHQSSVITMRSRYTIYSILVLQSFSFCSIHAFSIHSGLQGHINTNNPTNLRAVTPQFDEVCETTGVTLTRFMHEVERCNPELQELAQLFSGIQTASKAITNLVKRSQLPSSSVLGLEGAINVQGEDQKVGDWNLVFLIVRHARMLLQVHRRCAFSR
jgi:hypothetical protein